MLTAINTSENPATRNTARFFAAASLEMSVSVPDGSAGMLALSEAALKVDAPDSKVFGVCASADASGALAGDGVAPDTEAEGSAAVIFTASETPCQIL